MALLERFSAKDANRGSILTDDEAGAIATQELGACSSLCSRDHDLLDASLTDVEVLSPTALLRRLE